MFVQYIVCYHLALILERKQATVAENSGYEIVWLKHLAVDLESEGIRKFFGLLYLVLMFSLHSATDQLSLDLLDRAFIARLELDPQKMT
jgi:ubiquitin conjugation factor E4 B